MQFFRRLRHGVDSYFGIAASGSSFLTETRAGVTTFLTMAYVLVVNPQIIARAIGLPHIETQLMTSTALAAAIGTLVMGCVARFPFALAPGMGTAAYFAYTVVLGQGIPWQTALGAVFIGGVVFGFLSLTRCREIILNSIPLSLKLATTAGIGFFLAIIGFENAGFIVSHPATLVTLGSLRAPHALLALFGLLTIGALTTRGVRGTILIGIGLTTALAILTRAPVYNGAPFAGLSGHILQVPQWPVDLFMQMDLGRALDLGTFGIIFMFFFVDMFDSAGTLFALAEKCGFVDKAGRIPRANKAFFADATATMLGATLGTSSTLTYIESAAGVEEGGRTGFTSVVVAMLFMASLFAAPLAAAIPLVATAPALIIVGSMMMGDIGRIDWRDPGISIPAFLTIVAMPLTYSVANGISFGIIAFTALNLITGKFQRVHPVLAIVAGLLITRYVYLAGF